MKIQLKTILVTTLITAPLTVAQAGADKNALDRCISAGLEQHSGKVIALRAETEDGKAQYELDIHGRDGVIWEVECDAANGKISETEREVAADAPEFTSKAKIRLDTALKTALDKYPGSLLKIEYELEASGSPAYEFDIKTDSGKLLEVEVDAVSGTLGTPEEVHYQIGADQ